jgi:hypothetical protein
MAAAAVRHPPAERGWREQSTHSTPCMDGFTRDRRRSPATGRPLTEAPGVYCLVGR